jgi:hypothetical protein
MRRALVVGVVLVVGIAGCPRSREIVLVPVGGTCSMDEECETAMCDGVRCTSGCTSSADCPAGWSCTGGACGCTAEPEECNSLDDDCDARVDEDTDAMCGPGMACAAGACVCTSPGAPPTDEADILFVVDNSNSMTEEQASLVAAMPLLVSALASGDVNGDGTVDFDPLRSLHVGVVSTDMGAGGLDTPTCQGGTFGSMYGDDGQLLDRSRQSGCMAGGWPRVFDFARGGDPSSFARAVSCVAATGLGGCGFEQQLEATLKALSPSVPQSWTAPGYVAPVFFNNTYGHADRANAGFVRPESVLAVLLVTDEEDCSWADPELVNQRSTIYDAILNLRCFNYPMAVLPVERYVGGSDGASGLLGLRPYASRLVFGAIVGFPADLELSSYATILADARMTERPDPREPTRLVPSCDSPTRGVAYPPRRILRVAEGLSDGGASTVAGSICAADYTATIARFVRAIGIAGAGPGCGG